MRVFLLAQRIAHADADIATVVEPVASFATFEKAIWPATVVMLPAVDESIRRRR